MVDTQQLVTDIRSILQSNDQTFTDRLRDLATSYGAACDEANRRLRRCEDFLQKGLRSEAIHFAQTEPVLLDIVAALDFPERPRWEELSLFYQMPPAPKLLLETAAAVNQAFAQEKVLEPMLRQHRQLALARAPLSTRLATLRRIASADAGNPVWGEDITALETVRLRQIQGELERALAEDRPDTLFSLWDELHGESWSAPPPTDLLDRLHHEVQARHHLRQRQGAEKLARELARTFQTRDESQARLLRESWTRAVHEVPITAQDPLWSHVAPALRWLAHLDRERARQGAYDEALRALEQGLNAGAGAEELQELYYAVLKFKRGIPAILKQRYEESLDRLHSTSVMRERIFIATTILIGVMLLVGLLVFLVWRIH
jgi:hypothetical protein